MYERAFVAPANFSTVWRDVVGAAKIGATRNARAAVTVAKSCMAAGRERGSARGRLRESVLGHWGYRPRRAALLYGTAEKREWFRLTQSGVDGWT